MDGRRFRRWFLCGGLLVGALGCNRNTYPDNLGFCPKDGQRLTPPAGDTIQMYDPLIGTEIDGRYLVEALLGEGGMGFVYAARHVIIDKRVALKALRKEAAEDAASSQRFIAEARAAGRVPIVPYARPGTEEMGSVLVPYLPAHRLLLLSRHGALAWGESMEEAVNAPK